MDEDQFRHLLQLGHGRAILCARDHSVEGLRKAILDACLHCRAYDAQIEGTRASYMLDLLDLIPGKDSAGLKRRMISKPYTRLAWT